MVQDPRPLRRAAQAFFARGLQEESKQPDNEIKKLSGATSRLLWARLRLGGEEPLTSARHAGLRGVWLGCSCSTWAAGSKGRTSSPDIVDALFGATGRDSWMGTVRRVIFCVNRHTQLGAGGLRWVGRIRTRLHQTRHRRRRARCASWAWAADQTDGDVVAAVDGRGPGVSG